jgi:inorganic pyrophosphatase
VTRSESRRRVDAVIEIPRDSRNRYEWDHGRRSFRLDCVLYSSVHYPEDYGFIPGTVAEDGGPLDILVVVEEPSFTGCVIETRPIGLLDMADDKGPDPKVLGVPVVDPRFEQIDDLAGLPPHSRLEIAEFFEIYKRLEGKRADVGAWHGAEAAWRAIEAACETVRRTDADRVVSLSSMHLRQRD